MRRSIVLACVLILVGLPLTSAHAGKPVVTLTARPIGSALDTSTGQCTVQVVYEWSKILRKVAYIEEYGDGILFASTIVTDKTATSYVDIRVTVAPSDSLDVRAHLFTYNLRKEAVIDQIAEAESTITVDSECAIVT